MDLRNIKILNGKNYRNTLTMDFNMINQYTSKSINTFGNTHLFELCIVIPEFVVLIPI